MRSVISVGLEILIRGNAPEDERAAVRNVLLREVINHSRRGWQWPGLDAPPDAEVEHNDVRVVINDEKRTFTFDEFEEWLGLPQEES